VRALVYEGQEQITWKEVDDPTVEDEGDVIIETAVAGLCGSDLHPYLGREPGLDPGTVMGHEVAGVIRAVGPAVRSFAVGDRVVSPFTTSCGDCFFCRRGLTSRCERGQLLGWRHEGHGLHGAQAELVRLPLADSTLVHVPDDLLFEPALLAADVLAAGWFCAEQGMVRAGDVVVVLGCGAVGLCSLLALREEGVESVLAFDGTAERSRLATRFGAEGLLLDDESPHGVVAERTGGRGADVVLEAVGNPAAGRLAFDLVRPGGVISTVGVHTAPTMAFAPSEAYDKNLTYRVGRCPARRYLERLLPRLPELSDDLDALITQRPSLEAGAEAYRRFAARERGWIKAMFRP